MSSSNFGRFSRYQDNDSTAGSRPANIPLHEMPPSPLLASASETLLHKAPESSDGRLPFYDDDAPEPPMFYGPPPPISQSILVSGRQKSTAKALRDGLSTIKSVMFDPEPVEYEPRPVRGDPTWRNLMRRENAIETDLQGLLDMQAAGLHSGTAPPVPMGADNDDVQSAGSATPTGTWYSSRSQMIASINPMTRSTAMGDVIPIRQPKQQRQRPGLRAARSGIAHSIASLANLKNEEDSYVMAALAHRKTALSRLGALDAKKAHISEELEAVVKDGDEPISAQIALVEKQQTEVDDRIARLEKQLEQLHMRSRELADTHQELCSRREAGLSGFKGALRQVEKELGALLASPPVAPLDPQLVQKIQGHDQEVSEGDEILRLPSQRRTVGMVKGWWENDVDVLEKRQAAIRNEKEALDEGAKLWHNVVGKMFTFEQELKRDIDTVLSQGRDSEEAACRQFARMPEVRAYLEESVNLAHKKGWTLLICAIGAELEAFTKAEDTLGESLGEPPRRRPTSSGSARSSRLVSNEVPEEILMSRPKQQPMPTLARSDSEDSNSVPPDLLAPLHIEAPHLTRVDSENEVPPSLLTEQPAV